MKTSKQLLLFVFIIVTFISCKTLVTKINAKIDETNQKISEVKIPELDAVTSKLGIDSAINKISKDSTLLKIKAQTDEVTELLKKQIDEKLAKYKDSYNVTDFNYAITFGDNSASYEAEEGYKQAETFLYYLAEPQDIGNSPPKIQGQNYNYAGELFYVSNEFLKAEKSFNKAIEIYSNANMLDSSFAILTYSNLGLLYNTTGRYALSEASTLKALELNEKNRDNITGYAASLNNLSVLYKDMGKYNEAEIYINKAEKQLLENKEDTTVKYAIVLNNKAMLYQQTGKLDEAEKLLNQAIEIADLHINQKSATFVRLKVNLALLYQLKKDYERAEKIYNQAINIKKKRLGTKHPDYAMLLRNKASLYQQMGKYEDVENLLKEAIQIYEDKFGKENPIYAKTVYELGVFYQSQNKLDKAFDKIDEAIKIQEFTLSEHHPDLTATRENLAILYWQKNELELANQNYKKTLDEYIYQINTYFPAMNDHEKTVFWEQIQPKFIRYYSFAIEASKSNPEIVSDIYNYHIATKALLLNSSRKVKDKILKSGDKKLIKKYTEWQDLKGYIAKLYSYSNDDLKNQNINLDSLEEIVAVLEKDLTISSNIFKDAKSLNEITYKTISSKLISTEAAIEFIRLKKYNYLTEDTTIQYIGLVLKNNSTPKMVVFENGNFMEDKYIKEYKKSIMNGKSMEKFYTYYWEPLNELTKDSKTLYASLDGIYNQLNINTILLPSGNYILDEKNVMFVTNSKDIITLKISNAIKTSMYSKSAVLIGFPDYQLDYEASYILPLPGTKIEVSNIQTLLKTKSWKIDVFTEKNATEENLKKINNPYVLHIATHGFFIEAEETEQSLGRAFGIEPKRALENPLLRSGLLLAGADKTVLDADTVSNEETDDGILNAYEAMILDLDNTELVVLSACQTGLGEIKTGEGVYGLQRSFQIAGANSILTSLWEVSDEGTQDLMSFFYKYWLESGNKYDAFHKAQIDIKEKYKFPYYWGAFEIVGQ